MISTAISIPSENTGKSEEYYALEEETILKNIVRKIKAVILQSDLGEIVVLNSLVGGLTP